LAELLTVLAILLVLAGLLFPVFVSAKSAAKRTQCSSNMRQAQLASQMYMSDYDEIFMPVNHRPGAIPNARLDRTWVQLVLPYVGSMPRSPKSFTIFSCPADTSARESGETVFDGDLVPGEIYSQYYTASMHVTTGYNYLYLAPIIFKRGQWVSEPRSLSSVGDPSRTLLFVDSIWDRDSDGSPVGGGNWLVVPPCRYQLTPTGGGPPIDSFSTDGNVFTTFAGWKVSDSRSAHVYGNVWPWHSGRATMVRVDGSVASMPIAKLTAGCNVQDQWRGRIQDPGAYIWDTR
jgi:prepilin-type processing-associated H-X9-DG protein